MGRGVITIWLIVASVCFVIGLGLDIGSAVTMSWSEEEQGTFYTYRGLFKVCNGSREVTRRDKLEIWRAIPDCFFPTTLEDQWIPVSLGMELAGLAFGLATFVTLIVLLILLKTNWMRSRSALVAIIPISSLAGFFNIVGLVVAAVHLGSTIGWSLALDATGASLFLFGSFCMILDLQACCSRQTAMPGMGHGLLRPI